MNFIEAEVKFRQLLGSLQRGEIMSRTDFELQVSELTVLDLRGAVWEINPRTGKWMYSDGAEWVRGVPPEHDHSTVIPISEMSGPIEPPAPEPPRPAEPEPKTIPPKFKNSYPNRRRISNGAPFPPPPRNPDSTVPNNRVDYRAGTPRTTPRPILEWIPLTVISGVLLTCAISLLVGRHLVGAALLPEPSVTATRTRVSQVIPTPAFVSLPTQTPAPPPVRLSAKISEPRVNLRAGPSLQTKIVTKLSKDAVITLIGRNADTTWYLASVSGISSGVWVSAEFVQVQSGDPASLSVTKAP